MSSRAGHRAGARGWLLVGLIVLLSAVLIAFAGFAFLLAEHLRVTSLRRNQMKALYLAQAGVMQALYDVRADIDGPGGPDGNAIKLGTMPVPSDAGAPGPADDDVFILGGTQADFLLAAMISGTFPQQKSSAGGACGKKNRDRLEGWTLRNVAEGMSLAVSRIVVSWPTGPGAGGQQEGVVRIDLDEEEPPDWTSPGCVPVGSGSEITFPSPLPTITPTDPVWSVNRIWFATTDMDKKDWIEIRFIMSDDTPSTPSVRRVRFFPPTQQDPGRVLRSSASFTIKSLGEARRGAFPFVTWRRVQAEYRLNDADAVVGLQEPGRITSDEALLLPPAAPVAEQRPGYKELSQREP